MRHFQRQMGNGSHPQLFNMQVVQSDHRKKADRYGDRNSLKDRKPKHQTLLHWAVNQKIFSTLNCTSAMQHQMLKPCFDQSFDQWEMRLFYFLTPCKPANLPHTFTPAAEHVENMDEDRLFRQRNILPLWSLLQEKWVITALAKWKVEFMGKKNTFAQSITRPCLAWYDQ